jgi:hypothetical protein
VNGTRGRQWIFLAVFQGLVWGAAALAQAQGAAGEGFAAVVGSNVGATGQQALRYAEDDARRVSELLVELGHYRPQHIERLLRPSPSELTAAIGRVRARIAALAGRGEQSRFFFYYSGHARADALNLGGQELPLAQLREELAQLSATVSIVVLDACQSGAFSRVKGAASWTARATTSCAEISRWVRDRR